MDFAKIKARLDLVPEEFAGKTARFGWFPGAVEPDGQSVAYIALIQEMGAPTRGIPARPFIKPAIEKYKLNWAKLLGDSVKAVGRGKIGGEQALEMIGLQAAGDVRKQLASMENMKPLSPVTVLLRKWKRADPALVVTFALVQKARQAIKDGESPGNQNADPLHDTGLLEASLSNDVGTA